MITDDSNLSVEDELGVFLTFSADQMGQIDSVGAGIVQMVDQDLDDLMEVIAGVESDSAETSPLPRISRPLSKPQSSVLGKKVKLSNQIIAFLLKSLEYFSFLDLCTGFQWRKVRLFIKILD